MHFMHVPVHAELRGVVNVENVVEICGCWVVDAREADYVRMGSVARVSSPFSLLVMWRVVADMS